MAFGGLVLDFCSVLIYAVSCCVYSFAGFGWLVFLSASVRWGYVAWVLVGSVFGFGCCVWCCALIGLTVSGFLRPWWFGGVWFGFGFVVVLRVGGLWF